MTLIPGITDPTPNPSDLNLNRKPLGVLTLTLLPKVGEVKLISIRSIESNDLRHIFRHQLLLLMVVESQKTEKRLYGEAASILLAVSPGRLLLWVEAMQFVNKFAPICVQFAVCVQFAICGARNSAKSCHIIDT